MQKISQIGQYVTIKDAAKRLGIRSNTMYKRVVHRKLHVVKVGTTLMLRLSDIDL